MMTAPRLDLSSLYSAEEPCETCQGEGSIICQGGPGRYDRAFGNFLPSEWEETCSDCEGAGERTVVRCCFCDEAEGDCTCTEDDE